MSGLLIQFEIFPPPLLRVVLPTLLATALVCVASLARQWLQRWSLAGLVAFQGFLLPLELVMHLAMTYAGRNFVILTGLLALPLAWRLGRGQASRGWVWAWNLLGLGLQVNVVGLAIRSMPGPLPVFMNEPPKN